MRLPGAGASEASRAPGRAAGGIRGSGLRPLRGRRRSQDSPGPLRFPVVETVQRSALRLPGAPEPSPAERALRPQQGACATVPGGMGSVAVVSTALIDESLVVRSQAGDDRAISELAGLVRPLVQRYAARFFSDPARAEDLAQTALMKAFSRIGDVRSPEAFPAWVLRITRNECLNELARMRHAQLPLSALDDGGSSIQAPAGGEDDPEESLIRSQLQSLVRRVAAGLPDHYRRTLTMRALEDRTYEEISEELNVPVAVARLWYCRARKRFRRAFVELMAARRGVTGSCVEMGVAIAELIEGTLGRQERDRVQGHLAGCAVCRQTEDELRNTAFRAPLGGFVAALGGFGMLRLPHAAARGVRHLGGRVAATSRLAIASAGSVSLAAASVAGGAHGPVVLPVGAAGATVLTAAHSSASLGRHTRALPEEAPAAATTSAGAVGAGTATTDPAGVLVDGAALLAQVEALGPGDALTSLLSRTTAGPVSGLHRLVVHTTGHVLGTLVEVVQTPPPSPAPPPSPNPTTEP